MTETHELDVITEALLLDVRMLLTTTELPVSELDAAGVAAN
jgi:hypothetical protein